MNIDRRNKINFIKKVPGQDDYGEPTDTWEIIHSNIWSSKDPILGNEFFSGLTTDTKVDVKFNTRYIPGIENTMRIQHVNEVYEILSAINVKSLNRELLCYCKLVK
jgi:SPP1 family predicted phage head-tail adaptor